MQLSLNQVQLEVREAYNVFKQKILHLPTSPVIVYDNSIAIARISFSTASGIDFLYNCGINGEMPAMEANNLVAWWERMFPTYAASGQAALPPAKNFGGVWELHLFAYNDKAKSEQNEWWRYRFNFHVPLAGKYDGPVQLKSGDEQAIREGRSSYAKMGVQFQPKK